MEQTLSLEQTYVAAWSEADPALRSRLVKKLYARNGRVITASAEFAGVDEVVRHVGEVVAEFIGPTKHRFQLTGCASGRGCVLLRWEMMDSISGELADWGINILALGPDGRIVADCQFVAPWGA